MKDARRDLETQLESAMPCKSVSWRGETCSKKSDTRKLKYACIVEAHESTRSRTGKTQPRDHEDIIAEKEASRRAIALVVHKPVPILLALTLTDSEGRS